MNDDIVALFIPIILFIVTGIVMIIWMFFRSREKQMLIEKGFTADEIKAIYFRKKDNNTLMKIGIIALGFGIGLGIGLWLEDLTSKEFWVPFFLFVFTGIGFIAANLIGNKLNKESV
ncbi:MAG: DUF6249 domain-containing protein [Syntrophothermus sp.]